MTITVKFFASLKERIGKDTIELSLGNTSVEAVWLEATGTASDGQTLVAINHRYADFDSPVSDGDEVAFFPPVTGG